MSFNSSPFYMKIIYIWILIEAIILIFNFFRGLFIKNKKRFNFHGIITFITIFIIIYIQSHVLALNNVIRNLGDFSWFYPFYIYINQIVFTILILGIFIRAVSLITLNRQFSYDIVISKDLKLISHGIYKFIRHPLYLGTIFIILALNLELTNWIIMLFGIIAFASGIILRIKIEEKLLISVYGEEYIKYINRTKKLIPKVY